MTDIYFVHETEIWLDGARTAPYWENWLLWFPFNL